jgi:dynein heavy chain, axonemal
MISYDKGFKGDEKQKKRDLECLFAFAMTWGMGASLDAKGKDVFDSLIRDQFKSAQFPSSGLVFDYFYDLKKDKVFKNWNEKVETFNYDKNTPYFELIVPTTVTYSHKYCLELLLSVEKPCFFTGDSGVGKSIIVANTLNILSSRTEDSVMPININFSAQTSAARTQDSMLAKMEKMRMHYQPPPQAARIAVFVDDINMPTLEEYGAQPPIELLRLFLNKKGIYDRSDWSWKEVRKTTLVAAAAPPSGSRAELTQRFTTHFNMFCLPPAGEAMLQKIFGDILGGFLKGGFSDKVQ